MRQRSTWSQSPTFVCEGRTVRPRSWRKHPALRLRRERDVTRPRHFFSPPCPFSTDTARAPARTPGSDNTSAHAPSWPLRLRPQVILRGADHACLAHGDIFGKCTVAAAVAARIGRNVHLPVLAQGEPVGNEIIGGGRERMRLRLRRYAISINCLFAYRSQTTSVRGYYRDQ